MLQFSLLKKLVILCVCLTGVYFSLPNLFSESFLQNQNILPQSTLKLGLDLQGGSHILLGVDKQAVAEEIQDEIIDQVRAVFRKERIAFRNLGVNKTDVRDGIAPVNITIAKASLFNTAYEALQENIPIVDTGVGSVLQNQAYLFSVEQNPAQQKITLYVNPLALNNKVSQAVSQSIEIIRRRIDELGTNEPIIQRNGFDRILVQVPGLQSPDRLKTILGKTAKLTFHSAHPKQTAEQAERRGAPAGYQLYPFVEDSKRKLLLRKRAKLSGQHLVDAQAAVDQRNGEIVVNFRLDVAGGTIFRRLTEENLGKPLAIVMDGRVISAPTIQAVITSSGVISGNFTTEEANQLAILLRAGALPAPLITLEERTVGASLGSDSIAAGKIAGLLSFLCVAIFIIINYRLLGFFAFFSLVVNLTLIIGFLSLLQATLTLPGIAGIILTVGMAVDANVLIFERIKEELKMNKQTVVAMDSGYRLAFATILDANITTFIAAMALILLGSGPVRGFAITLGIGIITSVFTAYMLTRYITVTWFRIRRPEKLHL